MGNTTYNIVYDRTRGGYGYYYGGNRWNDYDPFLDVLVVGPLLQRHSYHYPGIYTSSSYYDDPYYSTYSHRYRTYDRDYTWDAIGFVVVIAFIALIVIVTIRMRG